MSTMEIEEVSSYQTLPLLSLNHVSLVVRSVWTSLRFYVDVLGFTIIKRPSSFKFVGAWLYNYGIGIHLIESETVDEFPIEPRPINPKDNHLSFQCTDVNLVKKRLEEMGMKYVTAIVEDEGIQVDQVFFHDPDGYMIEICNCENIPILPVSTCPIKPNFGPATAYVDDKVATSVAVAVAATGIKCGLVLETMMMDNLTMEMLNFAF
ncbi:OLC1v1010995C1 [Oldenlandia corymbosa var. corymbosa]|uniref:OLC1v1010995C1 n=1 Tax=Oldenlandia corymbosa var. corymbosa TaxID=529605 RepID=A0AAV1DVW0_OLDCO|nr:OLC1v1010995C1 [Oldenlandia corymbosa var. corymbosa]